MKSLENSLPAARFYAVCLIWVGLRRSQFAEICSVVDLLSICGVGNAEQRLLPTCQGKYIDGSLTLFKRHQTSFQADVPSLIFKDFFPVFELTIRKLTN